MQQRLWLIALFVLWSTLALASKKVPAQIEFGNVKVKLTDKARAIVQKDVDRLMKYSSYFQQKAAKARLHMPLVEQVLRQEQVPDDFKYLAIQESDFVADAVSSSKAVGYWQFKAATGKEMGLRIDGQVDERMNLVSATRAACKYLKTNNFYFDNWVYSLLSYHEGRGGATPQTKKSYYGARQMTVDHKMHWYVLRCFAHKIAFEEILKQPQESDGQLVAYRKGAGKSLKSIARAQGVPLAELEAYNKWLRRGNVPADKEYAVIIPQLSGTSVIIADTDTGIEPGEDEETIPMAAGDIPLTAVDSRYASLEDALRFPIISQQVKPGARSYGTRVNGLPGVQAQAGDTKASLARQGGLSLADFVKYNELKSKEQVSAGQVYYFKKKRNKAKTYYHAVQAGESMWSISQRFGVKLSKLYKKNRMRPGSQPKVNRVLWLRHIRPAKVPLEYRQAKPAARAPSPAPVQINPPTLEPEPESIPSVVEEQHKAEESEAADDVTTSSPARKEVKVVVIAEPEPQPNKQEPEPEAAPSTAETEPILHIVKAGETLYSISRLYQVKVPAIEELNGLASPQLSIDQRLLIPVSEDYKPTAVEPKEQIIYHTVQAGETMYAISKQYGVDVEQLIDWNEKADTQLQLGEKLRIIVPQPEGKN